MRRSRKLHAYKVPLSPSSGVTAPWKIHRQDLESQPENKPRLHRGSLNTQTRPGPWEIRAVLLVWAGLGKVRADRSLSFSHADLKFLTQLCGQ